MPVTAVLGKGHLVFAATREAATPTRFAAPHSSASIGNMYAGTVLA